MDQQTASYRDLFAALATEYNALLGMSPPSGPFVEPEVEFQTCRNDVVFALRHSLIQNARCMGIECRLGPLPKEDRETTLYHLLMVQQALTPHAGATLSLDPGNNDLCHTVLLPLIGTDAMHLHREMARLEKVAAHWRQSCFRNPHGLLLEEGDLGPAPSPVLQ